MNNVVNCINALFCPFPLNSGIEGKKPKLYQPLGLLYKKLIALICQYLAFSTLRTSSKLENNFALDKN